ncbi:MAG: fasciclin domain-containing protein [Balneolaceae bacterium]
MKQFKIISMVALAVIFMAFAPYSISTQDNDDHDIVSIAQDTDNLSTLVAAIEAAGLVDVLKGDGPFTVFAPTNEAFEALPDGTLESLLMPENQDQLVEILTYHVVAGEVMSGDLSDGMTAETVEGSEVTISLSDSGAKVNDANVEAADIEASNGVVHVIDAVILPPEDNSGY